MQKRRAIATMIGGLVLASLSAGFGERVLVEIVLALGCGCYIFGCALYAQAKGRSATLGALSGLLVFGPIILFFMKDKQPPVSEAEINDD